MLPGPCRQTLGSALDSEQRAVSPHSTPPPEMPSEAPVRLLQNQMREPSSCLNFSADEKRFLHQEAATDSNPNEGAGGVQVRRPDCTHRHPVPEGPAAW